ncbi:hypothetical protein B0T10DRAFT_463727 [Thelonectria olida]|uniref:Uncharacterized protein n=1 Tax=Thelonectria olida TaxID=1576542 RepID=A0A9P8VVF2_9HYPO|nr:hypothetical protein B0T10DRAFT_463727 [Thelonectria olida]
MNAVSFILVATDLVAANCIVHCIWPTRLGFPCIKETFGICTDSSVIATPNPTSVSTTASESSTRESSFAESSQTTLASQSSTATKEPSTATQGTSGTTATGTDSTTSATSTADLGNSSDGGGGGGRGLNAGAKAGIGVAVAFGVLGNDCLCSGVLDPSAAEGQKHKGRYGNGAKGRPQGRYAYVAGSPGDGRPVETPGAGERTEVSGGSGDWWQIPTSRVAGMRWNCQVRSVNDIMQRCSSIHQINALMS